MFQYTKIRYNALHHVNRAILCGAAHFTRDSVHKPFVKNCVPMIEAIRQKGYTALFNRVYLPVFLYFHTERMQVNGKRSICIPYMPLSVRRKRHIVHIACKIHVGIFSFQFVVDLHQSHVCEPMRNRKTDSKPDPVVTHRFEHTFRERKKTFILENTAQPTHNDPMRASIVKFPYIGCAAPFRFFLQPLLQRFYAAGLPRFRD